MSTTTGDRTRTLQEQGIAAQLRHLFEEYGASFSDLVSGKQSDVSVLLNFYGAPLRIIGANVEAVMMSHEEITGKQGMAGEIARLQVAHLTGSTLDKWDVRVLNPKAAMVEAAWTREDSSGVSAASTFVYMVVRTNEGWRITAVIDITSRR